MTKAQVEEALKTFGKEMQERRFAAVKTALADNLQAMSIKDLEDAFYNAHAALDEILKEEFDAEQSRKDVAKLFDEPQGADLESP